MYGQLAIELLRELQRSDANTLPPYNEDKVRLVVRETNQLYEATRTTITEHMQAEAQSVVRPEVAGCLLVYHAALLRNKRCLLAYFKERMARLQHLRWQIGASTLPETTLANLSAHEKTYFRSYGSLLSDYQRRVDNEHVDLNLSASLQPPKQHFIEVRCLEQLGDVVLPASGTSVVLDKDSQHLLLRADVEQLIRQGSLQHIPNKH
eukprot:m.98004 g.98004  ORF g.98004 m.98004 type:complete len:207 (-) comp15250_c0_seq2:184-804(-)